MLQKNPKEDRQVGWKSFTAAPLNVSLLLFQTYFKNHFSCHPMLPIIHVKDPLGKDLKTHLPVLLGNIWVKKR
jgi:hypothetical protein